MNKVESMNVCIVEREKGNPDVIDLYYLTRICMNTSSVNISYTSDDP